MAHKDTIKVVTDHGPLSWTLFTAWVGAAIYFYQQDPGFLNFFISLLKAAIWPAYVMHHVLGLLGI
jgi:hypothetical protein